MHALRMIEATLVNAVSAIFGGVRVLFGVFAALKLLAEFATSRGEQLAEA